MDEVVQAERIRAWYGFLESPNRSSSWKGAQRACLAAVLAIVVAVLGFFLHLPLSAAEPLELLLVLIVALRMGFPQASAASVVAVLCMDYLFTRPLFELTVADPQNWIALSTFETIALIVSRLSSDVRWHAGQAIDQQRRAVTLYQLSRAILHIQQKGSIAEQLATLIRDLVGIDEVSFWTTTDDLPNISAAGSQTLPTAHQVYVGAHNRDDAAARTSTRVLRSGVTAIGGMTLHGWAPDPLMTDAVASLAALAFERARANRRESRADVERDTEQLRTAVLDALAHSFKTPLTAIRTASSGLLEVGQLSAMQTELISIIDDRAAMLARLTTQLLQTAALDATQVRLHRTHVFLAEVMQRVAREQPASDQSRFRFQTPPGCVEDDVDVALVELALQQLLDNASKYSTPNTEIVITLCHNERETVMSVENAGPVGLRFDAEEKERLFDRFYRGAQREYGPAGTGLGLSVVKKVAEAHGGRAWVESDQGSTRFLFSVARVQGEKHGWHEGRSSAR